jgi:hypothetical protein
MTRPILEVIAHEATRTGSPRVLYDLLRSARGDIPASLSITLLARGSLAERLEALDSAPTGTAPPNAVLLNSCITAEALEAVPPGIPTAVYVHEDSEVIESLPPHTARGVTTADLVAAVSEASAAALVGIGVEPGRIRIVRPHLCPGAATSGRRDRISASSACSRGDRASRPCVR